MVSMVQMKAAMKLGQEGLSSLPVPHTANTPIPGLILYLDEGHTRLEMVQGDGTVVDLLAVYRVAVDAVGGWREGSDLPVFITDFGRLTKLAKAVKGRTP